MTAPPDVLDTIKDDLGIEPEDTTHDAWLTRRIAGIWARIEQHTGRWLASPPASFLDDWSLTIESNVHKVMPSVLAAQPRATAFLRVFPVVSITSLTLNGNAVNPALVRFDAASGRLLAIDGVQAADLGAVLLGVAKVTYTAGWSAVPADLYEVIVGAVAPQWDARRALDVGLVPGATSVSVQDVGSVDFGGGNPFVEAAAKTGAGSVTDPLLGVFASNLDTYVDWRSMLGASTYPVTTATATP